MWRPQSGPKHKCRPAIQTQRPRPGWPACLPAHSAPHSLTACPTPSHTHTRTAQDRGPFSRGSDPLDAAVMQCHLLSAMHAWHTMRGGQPCMAAGALQGRFHFIPSKPRLKRLTWASRQAGSHITSSISPALLDVIQAAHVSHILLRSFSTCAGISHTVGFVPARIRPHSV